VFFERTAKVLSYRVRVLRPGFETPG
jgi:hypothetical protein